MNIIENIALIQEVHERLPRQQSHANALVKLHALGLAHLAQRRTSQCTEFEIFAVSLIRASMMQYATIIITTPLKHYYSNDPLKELLEIVNALQSETPIMILDLVLHEHDYKAKGISCHTIV